VPLVYRNKCTGLPDAYVSDSLSVGFPGT
jgi:hypothetical protein